MKNKKTITIIFFSAFISLMLAGCGGFGGSRVDIPTSLNGDWNLKGVLDAKDDSIQYGIDRDFKINDGRIYLEGGGEWEAAKVGEDLNISFGIAVSEEDVPGCGIVRIMADATIIIPIIDDSYDQYDGIAVGLFRINSECDGLSSKELRGDFILKRR